MRPPTLDRVPGRLEFMRSLLPPDNWFGEAGDEDEEEAVADDEAIKETDAEAEP